MTVNDEKGTIGEVIVGVDVAFNLSVRGQQSDIGTENGVGVLAQSVSQVEDHRRTRLQRHNGNVSKLERRVSGVRVRNDRAVPSVSMHTGVNASSHFSTDGGF